VDKDNRPVGRRKRIGSGVGNVQRRGDGLGDSTGGPVGNPHGYSDSFDQDTQPTQNPFQTSDSEQNNSNNTLNNIGNILNTLGNAGSGGKSAPASGCSKNVIIFVLIAIALYFLYSYFVKNQKTDLNTGNNNTSHQVASSNSNSSSTYDTGAYAVSTSVSRDAREKYTSLQGNGKDDVTVMLYVCGTDLEGQGGAATADINEILHGEIADNVNVIMETGGTKTWRNTVIGGSSNQRYRLTNDGLELLEDDMGKLSMVKPSTLSDFIRFSRTQYPADRYILIMWDHGAGSLTGYGYDQYFQNDSMTLDELNTALKNGGCKFDFIGFDACLMGTFETAIALEPYADYLIASEEVEPGVGWYYTGWISALSQNTSIPTTKLGKILIDDYVQDVKSKIPQAQATLSLVDLAELKGTVPSAFSDFASSTNGLIKNKQFETVSDARAEAKEFASSTRINQVDLIHFARIIATKESKALANVVEDCIKYNRTSTNITDANGLSIFFPFRKSYVKEDVLSIYDEIGIDAEYSDCIRSFASVVAGGQAVSSGSNNMLDSLLGSFTGGDNTSVSTGGSGSDLIQQLLNQFLGGSNLNNIIGGLLGGSTNWLDTNIINQSADNYAEKQFDASALKITRKDGQKVIALTEKQWDMVQRMELNVFVDDGKGFIDLGLDNVYEYNDDGDLVMDYDGTWLAMNGQIVSYYFISEDRHGETYTIKGRVPALLNSQLVDIMIVFDNENPYGMVLGAQKKYDTDRETYTVAKGLLDIKAGDKIDFLCDYYTYDGKYTETYYLGKQYTATGEWEIENISIGNREYRMTYRFTDIYNNLYCTPAVTEK